MSTPTTVPNSMTAWADLPPQFVSDKVPPGWFAGCTTHNYKRWKELCHDWQQLTSYDTKKQMVMALRFRIKGIAYETARRMVVPTAAAPTAAPAAEGGAEGGAPAEAPTEAATAAAAGSVDDQWWANFWTAMDAKFQQYEQDINTERFDAFFDAVRKSGMTIREFIAHIDVLLQEARTGGLDLGEVAKSYWFLRAGRFTADQRRWLLTPINNDLTKYKELLDAAAKMPEELAKAIHIVEADGSHDGGDDDADWGTGVWWCDYDGKYKEYTMDDLRLIAETYNLWNDQWDEWWQDDSVYAVEEDWDDGDDGWDDDGDHSAGGAVFPVVSENPSDADTETDEKACDIFLAQRKASREYSKLKKRKGGDGQSKYRGGARPGGYSSNYPPKQKGFSKGWSGYGKPYGKKGKSPFGKGKKKGKPRYFMDGKGPQNAQPWFQQDGGGPGWPKDGKGKKGTKSKKR